jgi:hypothetical protein
MPPPPPPSKSYLLKFDSSSDEESSDEEEHQRELIMQQRKHQHQQQQQQKAFKEKQSKPIDSTTIANDNDNASTTVATKTPPSDIIDSQDTLQQQETKATKKRKKKRKKKKKTTAPSSSSHSNSISISKNNINKVHFSTIIISEFHRDIHGDGVPLDGGYPLALSHDLYRTFVLSVDEFEQDKQMELRGRYEKYAMARRKSFAKVLAKSKSNTKSSGRRKRSNSKVADEIMKASDKHVNNAISQDPIFIPDAHTFETRQFDYRETQKDAHQHHRQAGTYGQEEWKEIFETGRNILFGRLGESERKYLLFRDAHLNLENQDVGVGALHDDSDSYSSNTSNKTSSKRKDSISISNDDAYYCALDVQHVRHELEQLRIHRTVENVAGCDCRKLHVVLPKDLNGGGKKSKNHRRLTERRVKDELRKRHVAIPNSSNREVLEQLLHDEVETHGCCYGSDCPCSRSGIGCQSDTCRCWHMSHSSHKKESNFEEISPADATHRCGNKNGIYVVDFAAIEKHRSRFICGIIPS